jgi:nitroreductase
MPFDPLTRHQSCTSAEEALRTRQSIRAFLPKPVPRDVVTRILEWAARSPSGTNIQPWKVYVLTGAVREQLSQRILAAFNDPEHASIQTREYDYYPHTWVSPYIDRRRKLGWDLYGLLGIQKGDYAATHRQQARNYQFFDAPVGLMFTLDRVLERGSWLDCGMFMQSVMIAARAMGLDTCPQAAFLDFHRIVAECVGIPDTEILVCGMALGWADPDAIVNQLQTEREPVAGFTRFVGWDDPA